MATVGLFLVGWLAWRTLHVPPARPAAGRAAPALALVGLKGERRNLADMRGKRVLLVFWASWSPLALSQLQEITQVPAGSWEVLGVLADGARDINAAAEAASAGAPFPQLVADDATTQAWGGLPLLPVVCDVGPDGRIRHWHEGFVDRATLAEWRGQP